MPITRTPMVDDDGSGTTGTIINNAWKQELYNQIDSADLGTRVAWGVTDASGAGLTFSGDANYTIRGNVLFWWVHITFPTTANASASILGGFPQSVFAIHAGGVNTYGPTIHVHTPVSGTIGHLLKYTGGGWTNQELSGATVILQGSYFVA